MTAAAARASTGLTSRRWWPWVKRIGTWTFFALIAWLLGPDSGFVTGAEFITDGGMTRKMIYAE